MQHVFTDQCAYIRSDKYQFYNLLRWPIYIFNLVDITKLPCYPHRRSTTVSLESFTLYSFAYYKATLPTH